MRAAREMVTEVPASAEHVMATLMALERVADWAPHVHESRVLSEDEPAAGTRVAWTTTENGERTEHIGEIVAWEPFRTMAVRFDRKGLATTALYEVEPLDEGHALLTVRFEARPLRPRAALLLPLVWWAMGRELALQVGGIKALHGARSAPP